MKNHEKFVEAHNTTAFVFTTEENQRYSILVIPGYGYDWI